jgi:hypothetical protein
LKNESDKLSVTNNLQNAVTTVSRSEHKMSQPKTTEVAWVPWPKEDEIRWVEWRIREREGIESGRRSADLITEGRYTLQDYKAWILHVRDEISFQKIGNELFSKDADPENRKMKAYRAYQKVESEFRRGNLKKREPIGFWISAFGIATKTPD